MIDNRQVKRLSVLEHDRYRLVGEAAAYRLRAFDSINGFIPHAAKADAAIGVLRYAREHWALTGTIIALSGIVLRGRIGLFGLAQLVLRIGSNYLMR